MTKTYRSNYNGRELFARVYPDLNGLAVHQFAESFREQIEPAARAIGKAPEDFIVRGTNRNGLYLETLAGENTPEVQATLKAAGFNPSKSN